MILGAMIAVTLVTLAMVALCTLLHYEALQHLHRRVGAMEIPSRPKVLVVVVGAFVAHAVEIAIYGAGFELLRRLPGSGSLVHAVVHTQDSTVFDSLYFSAANYTSLGYGDLVAAGPMRLMAGAEALHGLLLIGWTASFLYIAMERFWNAGRRHGPH